MELVDHPYYVATQFHPEYLSRPLKPSPPFLGLMLASVGRLQSYLSRGCRLSPRDSDNDSDFIDSGQSVRRVKKFSTWGNNLALLFGTIPMFQNVILTFIFRFFIIDVRKKTVTERCILQMSTHLNVLSLYERSFLICLKFNYFLYHVINI